MLETKCLNIIDIENNDVLPIDRRHNVKKAQSNPSNDCICLGFTYNNGTTSDANAVSTATNDIPISCYHQ